MSEGEKPDISPNTTLALGLVGGLVGIYLTPINAVVGPLLAALGAVCAIIWGAAAIRRVASYGLGTGVPSIGYMSLAIGIIGMLGGLALTIYLGSAYSLAGPILALIVAMILGAIVALLGKRVIGMKIPVLVRCTTELAGASALSVLAFSAAIAGGYTLSTVLTHVIDTGFIGLLFIMNTMIIQHPFNASLGPNEEQRRTLKLAVSTAFFGMAIIGILSIPSNAYWWLISIVGAIGWFVSFRAFLAHSFASAASVRYSGLWPKEDEQ